MKIEGFKDFIGNSESIAQLKLKMDASEQLDKAMPHIGLFGPAGVGKTTLSQIIANELGAGYLYINSTVMSNPVFFRKEIATAAELAIEKKRCIVVLDEAHMLPKKVQENLLSLFEYPAILCTQGFSMNKNGKIQKDKYGILREELPKGVTFILASTNAGMLTDPMLSRLYRVTLENYTTEELAQIARLKIKDLSDEEAKNISSGARSARDVIKICENFDDLRSVKACSREETVAIALKYCGYEEYGLTKLEKKYIKYLGENDYCSLVNISSYLTLDQKEVSEKIEPFLIKSGYMEKETRGR